MKITIGTISALALENATKRANRNIASIRPRATVRLVAFH